MTWTWDLYVLVGIDVVGVVWLAVAGWRARARTDRGLAALGAAVAPLLDPPAPDPGAPLVLRWECSRCGETGAIAPTMFTVPPVRWAHRHFR